MKRVGHISGMAVMAMVSLAACDGSQGDGSSQDHPGLFSETVVNQNADGTISTTVSWLTADEIAALAASRSQGAQAAAAGSPTIGGEYVFIQDTSCRTKSIWVYDQPNATGNIICFDNVGAAPQAGYAVALSNYGWSKRVKSYWPGDLPGSFYNPTTFHFTSWTAWGPLTNAGTEVQGADTIIINGYSSCPSGGC